MLTLSGLKRFYFLPNFHDMRCKAPRVAEIVRNKYHRDPSEGMTTMEELRSYIRFLYGQYMEEKEQNRQQQAAMQESLDEMARQLKEANATARLESDERRKMWQQFESCRQPMSVWVC